MEVMKLTLPGFHQRGISGSIGGRREIIASVQNQEIRQGYQAQMMDEIRHTQLETGAAALLRQALGRSRGATDHRPERPCTSSRPGLIGVSAFLHFNTGDPIDLRDASQRGSRDGVTRTYSS